MKNLKKIISIAICFVIMLSFMLVPASAADCTHENYTTTYQSLSSDSHRVINTCDDCGKVWSNTAGCSQSAKKTVATPLTESTHYAEIRCADCNNLFEVRTSESCYYVIDGNTCVCGKVDPDGCTHPVFEYSYSSQSSTSHWVYRTCTLCLYRKSEIKGCSTSNTRSISTPVTGNTHSTELRCADCGNLLEYRKSEACYYVREGGTLCICGNFDLGDVSDKQSTVTEPVSLNFIPLLFVLVFIIGIFALIGIRKNQR